MRTRKQPTIEKPLNGVCIRLCLGYRMPGDPSLSLFRKMGGRVVTKGPADILIIEYPYDGMVLDYPPKWMGYDARTELAQALADNNSANRDFRILGVSAFNDFVIQYQTDRRAARETRRAEASLVLDASFEAAGQGMNATGFIGF